MDTLDNIRLSESQATVLDAPVSAADAADINEDTFIGEDADRAEINSADLVDHDLEEHVLAKWPDALGLPPERFDDLAATSAGQRIVVIHRRDGVAYSTLFSILAALMFDGLLLAGLYFLNHLQWAQPVPATRAIGVTDHHDSTAIGGMVLSSLHRRTPPTDPLKNWRMSALPPPQLFSLTGRSRQSSGSLLTGTLDIPQKHLVIGVPQGTNTWVQPRLPKMPHMLPRPKQHRATDVPHVAVHPRSRGPRSRGPLHPGAQDDGVTFNFMKNPAKFPGAGGSGRGRGGWSADRQATPKQDPLPQLPLKYILAGTKVQIVVRVLVLPNGRVSHVTIVKSSGHPTIDHLFIGAILNHWKFVPARKDNMPIRSYWQESINVSAD
ncbi:MAG: TonB family protein [Phycisphaerae bacterium]|nr:TonB family protein [Phycisphaerae bacterium]